MNALIFVVAILTVLVLVLIVMVFALARQVGVLFERITPVGAMINDAGPQIGETSPVFNLRSLSGDEVVVGGKQSKSTLLFFLSPSCPICNKLLPSMKSVRNSESNWLNIILASDGEPEKHNAFVRKYALEGFPYVLSEPLGLAFRVSRLPFAVLLGLDGNIQAKGLINTREQLDSLFNVADTGFASIQDFVNHTGHPKSPDTVNT